MRREAARVLLIAVGLASVPLLAPLPVGGAAAGAPAGGPVATETTPTVGPATPNESVDDGLVALYRTDDGEVVREAVITPADIAEVGAVDRDTGTGSPYVVVTLTEAGAENVTEAMLAAGFGDGGNCRYETADSGPGECLLTVVDGEVVYSAGIQSELGRTIESGEFAETRQFAIYTENESQAESLRTALADVESADENGAPTATAASTATAPTSTTGTSTPSADGSVPGLTAPSAFAAVVLALLGAVARGRHDAE